MTILYCTKCPLGYTLAMLKRSKVHHVGDGQLVTTCECGSQFFRTEPTFVSSERVKGESVLVEEIGALFEENGPLNRH